MGMAEEGKPVRESRGGGFGGSGFKFDEHEAAYTSEKKKFQSPEGDIRSYNDMVERHIHPNTLPCARKTTKKFQVTIPVIPSVTLTLLSEGLASLLAWVSGSL